MVCHCYHGIGWLRRCVLDLQADERELLGRVTLAEWEADPDFWHHLERLAGRWVPYARIADRQWEWVVRLRGIAEAHRLLGELLAEAHRLWEPRVAPEERTVMPAPDKTDTEFRAGSTGAQAVDLLAEVRGWREQRQSLPERLAEQLADVRRMIGAYQQLEKRLADELALLAAREEAA